MKSVFDPYDFTELFKQWKLIGVSVLFASKTNLSHLNAYYKVFQLAVKYFIHLFNTEAI